MHIDMHYYGTYALARAAGLKSEVAQTIATASQFVDEHAEPLPLELADGTSFDALPTAHTMTQIQNLERGDQRQVWVPFHFLPGCEGDNLSQRLICRKNSNLAQEMITHHLDHAREDFGLELIGITAHVFADTFSHYGFSGVSSRWNRVDTNSFQFRTANLAGRRPLPDIIRDFLRGPFRSTAGSMKNFRAVALDTVEAATGALGHGAVATYPDIANLEWSFLRELTKTREGRNNPETYVEACRELYVMFTRLGKAIPDLKADEGRGFPSLATPVGDILRESADDEAGIAAWKKAASSGQLFAGGKKEEIPPYPQTELAAQIKALKESPVNVPADHPLVRFFKAAHFHRCFVLNDLLPKHNIVIG